MKNLITLIALTGLLLSCGREVEISKAPHAPFSPTGLVQGTLPAEGDQYRPVASLFSMFFWPDIKTLQKDKGMTEDQAREEVARVASIVAKNSVKMDRLYQRHKEIKTRMPQLQKELAAIKEELASEYKAIYDSYGCYVKSSSSRKCLDNDDSSEDKIFKAPESCKDVKKKPWKHKRAIKKACVKRVNALENRPEMTGRQEELQSLEEETFSNNLNIIELSQTIVTTVDGKNESGQARTNHEYINWMLTDLNSSSITFDASGKAKIHFSLRINNLKDNRLNDFISYSSEENEIEEFSTSVTGDVVAKTVGPDIVNIKTYVDSKNLTTTLSFTMYEKRVVIEDEKIVGEERTGNTLDFILRRTTPSFGLVYQGDIYRKNSEGKTINVGTLKMIFEPKDNGISEIFSN